VADKIDEHLREYFTGGLDLLIAQRKEDLRFNDMPDENVGGGRAQNSKVNRTELELMAFEEDEMIRVWEMRKRVIQSALLKFNARQLRVFELRYRSRASWASVEVMYKVPKSTGTRWCAELRNKLKKDLK